MNGSAFFLIDLVIVVGALLVVPMSLGRHGGRWALVAAATAVAFTLPTGTTAGLLALPWLAVAVAELARVGWPVLTARRWPTVDDLAEVALPGWAVIAGSGLVDSCFGWDLFGFGEPITRLTAVHFTYAGVATTAMALALRPRRGSAAGLWLVLLAPCVVFVGFFTGWALFQVGGAVLMTAGAYAVAVLHLGSGWGRRREVSGRLLLVSGLSVWLPMVLAVAWALAEHTDGPALSIPDLVRIHGSLNAFGFVGCGLAARWLDRQAAGMVHDEGPAVAVADADADADAVPPVVVA